MGLVCWALCRWDRLQSRAAYLPSVVDPTHGNDLASFSCIHSSDGGEGLTGEGSGTEEDRRLRPPSRRQQRGSSDGLDVLRGRVRRVDRVATGLIFKTIPPTVGGDVMLRSFPQARRLLRRMGFEKGDAYFFKQMGKGMLCTYALFGAAWLWNETSPLGWWTLKPRPKEEKEMAHLYERREFPYPGDEEAVEEFIKSGGALGTTIGPKGFADANMDSDNMQKQLQSKKFDQEAQKLWFRMRNEVVQELQEKGFDVE